MSDLTGGDLMAACFCIKRQWLAAIRLTLKGKLMKMMVALYFGTETGNLWAKNKGLTSHSESFNE